MRGYWHDYDGNVAFAYLQAPTRPVSGSELAAWRTRAREEQSWNTLACLKGNLQETSPRVELLQGQGKTLATGI
ncbi:hypothetical protein V2A60_000486 [Cordyceps javanica]